MRCQERWRLLWKLICNIWWGQLQHRHQCDKPDVVERKIGRRNSHPVTRRWLILEICEMVAIVICYIAATWTSCNNMVPTILASPVGKSLSVWMATSLAIEDSSESRWQRFHVRPWGLSMQETVLPNSSCLMTGMKMPSKLVVQPEQRTWVALFGLLYRRMLRLVDSTLTVYLYGSLSANKY